MKKDVLANAATAVLAICALIVTTLVVRRELGSSAPPPSTIEVPRGSPVENWREYASQGHSMGPANAPVTVVAFSDFQCPACKMFADSVQVLRQRHPGRVRVVYRHFPLQRHPFAVAAARASDCAAAQGRFEQFHDALFAAQDSIGVRDWTRFATTAGVRDLDAFRSCVDDTAPSASLARDTAMARRLGVTATPTLLLNGTRVNGTLPLAVFERYLEQEIGASR